jgi:hypothetical protein
MTINNLLHISDMFGTMDTVLRYDDYFVMMIAMTTTMMMMMMTVTSFIEGI